MHRNPLRATAAALLLFMLPLSSALSSSAVKLLGRSRAAAGHTSLAFTRSASNCRWGHQLSWGQSTRHGVTSPRGGTSYNIHTMSTALSMSEGKESVVFSTGGGPAAATLEERVDGDGMDEDKMDEEEVDVTKLLEEVEGNDIGPPTEPAASQYRNEYEDLSTKFTSDTTNIDDLQPGTPDGFFILEHATIPSPGFDQSQIEQLFSEDEIKRLKLKPDDVNVPAALRLLFPQQFASNTRARKESRRRKILVHRGPLVDDTNGEKKAFDQAKLHIGKVGDRVRPGDTLAIQTRMTHRYDAVKDHHAEPPFHLPVVYEDDHFAVVNKPEGIIVFGFKNGGYGRHTVKSCLPWALTPPKPGILSVMRRPSPVHRIDRGTSGLLVCAKTKPAMVELARMFKERKVKKTYTAVVNGDIEEPVESSISSTDAKNRGVCIGNGEDTSWQIIDEELEGQSAVTIWRALQKWPLENARNNTVTLVELKPKTGRFHQLRRHMAWVSKCPLLGDKEYDGGGLAKTLRDKGFYLCSNRVTLEHPYYNLPQGRKAWESKKGTLLGEKEGGKVRITEENGIVLVHCEIDLPSKFSEIGKEEIQDSA